MDTPFGAEPDLIWAYIPFDYMMITAVVSVVAYSLIKLSAIRICLSYREQRRGGSASLAATNATSCPRAAGINYT